MTSRPHAIGDRVTEIAAGSKLLAPDLGELWRFRELGLFLVWRDVKVRYKQTLLGALWALLQPALAMAVFTVFFGRLAGLGEQTGGAPYPIFVYAGLLPWTFFQNAVTSSGGSLIGNANLITKVYFPRLLIPLGAIGAGLVDLLIAASLLFALMLGYGIAPTASLLLLPLFVLGALFAAAGVGALLSALTVKYRDFRYVVPYGLQLWLFLTPVIYPPRIVPESWRWVLALNPMSGVVEGFRAAVLGTALDSTSVAISALMAASLFVLGTAYFRRVERSFADVI